MSNYIIHFDTSDYIAHVGNKNSGRYPRGSGERPHQHDGLLTRFRRRKDAKKMTKNVKKNKSIDTSKMTDQELRDYVNRLRLTKEIEDLTNQLVNKNANTKPKKDGAVVKAGSRILETALAGGGLYLSKALIGKEFNRKDLADAVFRGGAKK